MGYVYLANLVVAIHAAYVLFVVAGLVLIAIGGARRWGWVRNPWFRVLHLAAILLVAAESLADIACPLTVWEYRLRNLAGQETADDTFIGRFLHHLLFYDFEPWVFTTAYVGFALLVLATFVLIPPAFQRKCSPVSPDPATRLAEPGTTPVASAAASGPQGK